MIKINTIMFWHKIFKVIYDPVNIITYVGIEKSTISFDFVEKLWIISLATNPRVRATSKAPFKSMAIGNFEWMIENDTRCNEEPYTTLLSFTSCQDEEFTCNDGLCTPISNRYFFRIKKLV